MQHMWHQYEDQDTDSLLTAGTKIFQSSVCCRGSMVQAFLDVFYLLEVIFQLYKSKW